MPGSRILRVAPTLNLRPLTADYWLDADRPPYWRLAAAFALSPLIVAIAFAGLALAIYVAAPPPNVYRPPAFGPHPAADGWQMALDETWRTFLAIWLGVAVQVAMGGLLMIPLLWSLRLRSRTAWVLSGATIGLVFGLISWANTGVTSGVALVATTLFGACAFFAFRFIAGVRKRPRKGLFILGGPPDQKL